MAYPLAGHTNSYHTYSFDEALAGIAGAGYKGVELSAVPGLDRARRASTTIPPRCAASSTATG